MTLNELETRHRKILADCFDFSPPHGWYELVDGLLSELEVTDQTARVAQVKEKYGALRVYLNEGVKSSLDTVADAENKSLTICQLCGAPGSLGSNTRVYATMCSKCKRDGGP